MATVGDVGQLLGPGVCQLLGPGQLYAKQLLYALQLPRSSCSCSGDTGALERGDKVGY